MDDHLHKITFLITFLFLFTVYAKARNGAIKGQILDENKLGMPGAAVLIDELQQGTVTDSRGNFEFYNIEKGEYNLTISYLGYENIQEKIEVKENKTSTLKTFMNPGVVMGNWIFFPDSGKDWGFI